jgi:Domain of unknown function (DUF5666)/Domain of unknown function (DUF4382)
MQAKNKVRFSVFAALLALASITAGCGSGSGSSAQSNAATSPVQVSLGDAPSDWMMAFAMNVKSITLTDSNGATVNVLTSATPMEMMNLTGTVQPLTTANIPQGTYTQATINVAPVSMGYMDPTTRQYVQKPLSGTYSGTVTFNPPMTVGTGSSVMSFDMNMANSVSINSSGNVTITPMFTATTNPTSTSTESPWRGYMQNMVGSVSSTSGSQFTLSMMMGQQSVTFTTDSNTQFQGVSGTSGMSKGMVVTVDAVTQPDGSLLAQNVESMENSSGMMAGGFIGNITGTPATGFTMAANSGSGGGMMMSNISSTMAITMSSGTTCTFDSTGVDLTNLPFSPTNFSTNCAIAPGQMIDVFSTGGMMMGGTGGGMMGGSTSSSMDASKLRLEPQGMHGTVSNYNANGSQATFTLTVPSDSAFATMTGMTAITVYKQAGTQMFNTPSLGNGSNVEVRGLMFDDAGTYKMVAAWIVTPTT